jgi:hypothetical protein
MPFSCTQLVVGQLGAILAQGEPVERLEPP